MADQQDQQEIYGNANPTLPPNAPNVQQNAGNQFPDNAVNRIQVRIPPFWKQNPQLFRQPEAQFANNSNIVLDLTKFNIISLVLLRLSHCDILFSVSDIVLNPPTVGLSQT